MADGISETPEYWAEATPNRPAVVDGDEVLTYAEWNARADRLAAALRDSLPDEHSVGVRLHQSTAWFVINLALAKLGREQIAVNWRLTAHETGDILADSGAAVLFLDDAEPDALIEPLRERSLRFVTVGPGSVSAISYESLVSRPSTERLRSSRPTPLVMYSSGTTGKPKGVRPFMPQDEAARQQLFAYLGNNNTPQTTTTTPAPRRTLLTLPLHHGIGPKSAWSAHERGGTVFLLDRYDPVRALEIIQEQRITHWTTVPTMLRRIRALPGDLLKSFDVSSMKVLASGSAPSSPELNAWADEYFGNCLYEGYGVSEVGMVTLMRPRWRKAKPGSCGKPRAQVSIRIVGPDGTEAPPGTGGEIYVKTPVTITGYINQAPLDGDTLTEDGYFRTGDFGELDADGFLHITGRTKDMIIAGGVNIFPAEIERALADHPDVLEAAVIGIPEETFGEQVIAFCEVTGDSPVTATELEEFIAPKLAPFKRPRRIELVRELPRNHMDKVLKNELRQPYWTGRQSSI